MLYIGILIGIGIGYFIHIIVHGTACFGNVIVNDSEMQMLFEFKRSPNDIPNHSQVYFNVVDARNNILSSNGTFNNKEDK